MTQDEFQRLSPDRVQQLAEMAEWVRNELDRSVGYEVVYDATGVQLLDEWVEHILKTNPQPERNMRLLWTVFLGEVFRRRHQGEWALNPNGGLVVVFPTSFGGSHVVDVSAQVKKRIAEGFAASLALYYTEQGFMILAQKAG